MENLRHPNICIFIGACTKPPNLALVLEVCIIEKINNSIVPKGLYGLCFKT
jgi:hypothetical protein